MNYETSKEKVLCGYSNFIIKKYCKDTEDKGKTCKRMYIIVATVRNYILVNNKKIIKKNNSDVRVLKNVF